MRVTITIDVPSENSLAIVAALCNSGLLKFEVLPARNKQHLRKKMEDTAMRKIAAHTRLRDALVTATEMACPIYFVSGSGVRAMQGGLFLGLNCNPQRAIDAILGRPKIPRLEHV